MDYYDKIGGTIKFDVKSLLENGAKRMYTERGREKCAVREHYKNLRKSLPAEKIPNHHMVYCSCKHCKGHSL